MEARIKKLESEVAKITRDIKQCKRMPAQLVLASVETQAGVPLEMMTATGQQTDTIESASAETQTYALFSITERGTQTERKSAPVRPRAPPAQSKGPSAGDRLLKLMKTDILPVIKNIDGQWFINEHNNGTLNHDVNAVCNALKAIQNRKFTTENVVEVLTVALTMFTQTYSQFYNNEEEQQPTAWA